MSNTSATGGYLLPTTTTPIPGGLTLIEFIQTVLVGISGLDPTLVRPKWQPAPPKMPDISANWIAFGVIVYAPDANAYVNMDASGNQNYQRHQDIKVQCSIYGPNAYDYANLLTDGFQIQQNLEQLFLANMGFVSTGQQLNLPELINERWFTRIEMDVNLRREITRVYPVLSLVGAKGTIYGDGSSEFTLPWQAGVV